MPPCSLLQRWHLIQLRLDGQAHIGPWGVSVNMTMIEAGFNYARKWVEGEITERCDKEALLAEMKAIGGESMEISNYSDDNGTLDNFFLVNCTSYINY